MSKNIKRTRYTVTSYPYYYGGHGDPRIAVFGDLEIQQMVKYVQQENESKVYMHVIKETITVNCHVSKNNFPWLKTQEVKKSQFNVERYCSVGEPKSPNAGFFDFIGYQH